MTALWASLGVVPKGVVLGVVGLGLSSIFVGVERVMSLRSAMRGARAFLTRVDPLIRQRDWDGLLAATDAADPRVPLTRLVRAGLETFRAYAESPGALEICRREMERKGELLSLEVRRGVGFLASTAIVAPVLGLLGTLLGIILGFARLAASVDAGIPDVAATLARSLVPTAAGLATAIVAVGTFHYVAAHLRVFDIILRHAARRFLDHMEGG